jgi:hypothetical protein
VQDRDEGGRPREREELDAALSRGGAKPIRQWRRIIECLISTRSTIVEDSLACVVRSSFYEKRKAASMGIAIFSLGRATWTRLDLVLVERSYALKRLFLL